MQHEFERGAAALVVFEDVHLADEATLDLLEFLGAPDSAYESDARNVLSGR